MVTMVAPFKKRLRVDEEYGFFKKRLRVDEEYGFVKKRLRVEKEYGFLANNYGFDSDENYGKQVNEKARDSFSRLPFDIVICILSCLPTICAVQTCILARYWRNMWTHLNNLRLDDKGAFRDKGTLYGKARIENFTNSVNRVLDATDNNLTLKSFRLSCKTYNASLITTWILAILMRKVQYLVIEAKARGTIVLALGTTNWNSLTKLKISSNCNLQIPGELCFPNLKSLYLSGRRGRRMFSIENVAPVRGRGVLLIFPVLEEFIIKHCKWLNTEHVEIQAPELTRFRTHCAFNHCEIKICAAKLEKFESEGHIDNLDITKASSVNYMALNHLLDSDVGKLRAIKILKVVPRLKHLKLSSGMIKYFAQDHLVALPAFSRVKQLELWYWGLYEPEDMLQFLHLFPSLESLNLSLAYTNEFVYNKVRALPPCFASHLKEVQFTNFNPGQYDHIDTLKLFLENVKNLQTALVCADRCQPRKTKAEIRDVLLPLLPESSSCRIVVSLQRQRSHSGEKRKSSDVY